MTVATSGACFGTKRQDVIGTQPTNSFECLFLPQSQLSSHPIETMPFLENAYNSRIRDSNLVNVNGTMHWNQLNEARQRRHSTQAVLGNRTMICSYGFSLTVPEVDRSSRAGREHYDEHQGARIQDSTVGIDELESVLRENS